MDSFFRVNADYKNNPFFLALKKEGLKPGQIINGQVLDIKGGKALIQYKNSSFWAQLTGKFPSDGDVQLRILGERNGQLLMQYQSPLEAKGVPDERITDLLHRIGIPSTPEARELVQLLFSYQLPVKKEILYSLLPYLKEINLKDSNVRDSLAFLIKEGLPIRREGFRSLTIFFQENLKDLLKNLMESLERREERSLYEDTKEAIDKSRDSYKEVSKQVEAKEVEALREEQKQESPSSSKNLSPPNDEALEEMRMQSRESSKQVEAKEVEALREEQKQESPSSSKNLSPPNDEALEEMRMQSRESSKQVEAKEVEALREGLKQESPSSFKILSPPNDEALEELRGQSRESSKQVEAKEVEALREEQKQESLSSSKILSPPNDEALEETRMQRRESSKQVEAKEVEALREEQKQESPSSFKILSSPNDEALEEMRMQRRESSKQVEAKEASSSRNKEVTLALLKEALEDLPLKPKEEEITPQRIKSIIEKMGIHHEHHLNTPSTDSSNSLKSLLLELMNLQKPEEEEIEGLKSLLGYITGKQMLNLGSDTIYLELPIYYEKEWSVFELFVERKGSFEREEKDKKDLYSIGIYFTTNRLGEIGARILLQQKELSIDFYSSLKETEMKIKHRQKELERYLTKQGLLVRRITFQRMRRSDREEHFALPKMERGPLYYGRLDLKV